MIPPASPNNIRGETAAVYLVIDSIGRVKADSVRVCGLSNVSYATNLARTLAAVPFRPAEIAGRPIRSVFVVKFTF
jgi:hypothetical protein